MKPLLLSSIAALLVIPVITPVAPVKACEPVEITTGRQAVSLIPGTEVKGQAAIEEMNKNGAKIVTFTDELGRKMFSETKIKRDKRELNTPALEARGTYPFSWVERYCSRPASVVSADAICVDRCIQWTHYDRF